MVYCKPWTVFGDDIKGLNSKFDNDGSVISLAYISNISSTDERQPYKLDCFGVSLKI